ncbi:hypothetical protein KIPB_000411 [Kipferlia bialata]|uniref:Uncharacterized protein n=1 Tax=Kipferlia bialata TaxID=797122 RepID=A0A9K3CMA9_9EUKA|nr:hypothetical protein KIPB_000411 [Kipferlia bialata]|eukprot:g411.t1
MNAGERIKCLIAERETIHARSLQDTEQIASSLAQTEAHLTRVTQARGRELSEVRSRLDTLTGEREAVEAQLSSDLAEERRLHEVTRRQYTNALAVHETERGELSRRLLEAGEEAASAKDAAQAASALHAQDQDRDRAAQSQALAQLHSELHTAQDTIRAEQARADAAERECQAVTAENQALAGPARLFRQAQAEAAEVRGLLGECERAREVNDAAKTEADALRHQLEAAQAQVQRVEAALTRAERDGLAAREECTGAQQQRARAEAAVAELESRLAAAEAGGQRMVEELRQREAEAREGMAAREAELAELRGGTAPTRAEVDSVQRQAEQAGTEAQEYKARLQEAVSGLVACEHTIKILHSRNETLEKNLDAARRETTEQESVALSALQGQLVKAQGEGQMWRERLDEAKAERQVLEGTASGLREEVERLRQDAERERTERLAAEAAAVQRERDLTLQLHMMQGQMPQTQGPPTYTAYPTEPQPHTVTQRTDVRWPSAPQPRQGLMVPPVAGAVQAPRHPTETQAQAQGRDYSREGTAVGVADAPSPLLLSPPPPLAHDLSLSGSMGRDASAPAPLGSSQYGGVSDDALRRVLEDVLDERERTMREREREKEKEKEAKKDRPRRRSTVRRTPSGVSRASERPSRDRVSRPSASTTRRTRR